MHRLALWALGLLLALGCKTDPDPPEAAPTVAAKRDPLGIIEAKGEPDSGLSKALIEALERPDPQELAQQLDKAAEAEGAAVPEEPRGIDGAAAPAAAGALLPPEEAGKVGPGTAGDRVDADPLRGYRGRKHVVDPGGAGDFLNIAAAVAAAGSGDRILVRPGVYDEPLRLERPVAIIGDGPRESVVVEVSGDNVVVSSAVRALLSGLTLRQAGGKPARYGIDVSGGRLVMRDCAVQSASLAAVAVRASARLEISDCRIADSAQSGIFVYEGADATVVANDISGNGKAGIEVKGPGKAVIARNHVHDGGASGIFVHAGGTATIEGNYVTRNRLAGVEAKSGARITLRDNRIVSGAQSGIFVNEGAGGLIEGNTVRDNGLAGLELKSGADPVVKRNTFEAGKQSGIYINVGALGTLEDNTVVRNALAGIEVNGANPQVRRNTVQDNQQSGIYIHSNAGGVFEQNRVWGNAKAGFEINRGASPKVRRNIVGRNGYQGVWVLAEGGGQFEGNRFEDNTRGPVRLDGLSRERVSGDLPLPPPPVGGAPPEKDPTRPDEPTDLEGLMGDEP